MIRKARFWAAAQLLKIVSLLIDTYVAEAVRRDEQRRER